MKASKLLYLIILLFGLSSSGIAQKISGNIVDKTDHLPIIGATIKLVGAPGGHVGAITDDNGNFTMDAPAGPGEINISYIGYITINVKYNLSQKTNYRIELEQDTKMLDEVVVVGYGTQRKENLTGAVSSVDVNKAFDSRPITDVGRALQGAVPGLLISTTTGEIGSSPAIKIRGSVGSPNGNSNPMILVDNVVIPDLNMVNPDDIESISVLKDAASTSIYGARAAFGVILITTKTKKIKERTSISYSNNFAWRKPTVLPEQLPGWQQGEMNMMAENRLAPKSAYNMLGTIWVDDASIKKMKDWQAQYGGQNLGNEMQYGRDFEFIGGRQFYYRTWDWYDMFYKDWMPQQTHNLSINTGNEKTAVHIGLGYLGQDGLTKTNADSYDRYNATLGVNMKAYKWMDLRANISYSKTERETPFVYNSTSQGLYDYLYYLYRWQPMYPYGTYNGQPFRGAITELDQASRNNKTQGYLRMTGGATFKILPGLTLDADLTYSNTQTDIQSSGGPIYGLDFWSATTQDQLNASYKNYADSKLNYVQNSAAKTELYSTNVYATYNKMIKKDHTFKLIAGTNIESSETKYILAKRMNLYDPTYPEQNLAYGDMSTDGSHSQWSVAGFFGRINYDYKNRYLLEVNGRYDGSSSFPSNHLWGFFPSFSVGWRASEESFMNVLKPALSSLKLRGSYGAIGNQDVGTTNIFLSTISMNPAYAWLINGNYQSTAGLPKAKSPIVTWETVKTMDFGFDARFLSDQVGVTFDWYKRTTSGVLAPGSQLPSTFGIAAPIENSGELQTPGWELALDFHHQFNKDLKISVTGQITDCYTKVTKWSVDAATRSVPSYGYDSWYSSTNYYQGMVLGDIWGYKVDRLFQKDDFEADGTTLKAGIPNQKVLESGNFKFGPGDIKYKDLDGSGVIDYGDKTIAKPGDKTVIGNIFPRYQYGMSFAVNYKDFDFNIFFQGVGNRKMWVGGNMVLPGFTSGEPWFKGQEDYWTAENPNAFYPRPTVYGQALAWNYQVNDRYLLDMSYLRCKTLTFGYSIPRHILSKARITNLRVYLTGENLFEFTNLNVPIDPETGITTGLNSAGTVASDVRNYGRSYPYQRTFSAGLQLSF